MVVAADVLIGFLRRADAHHAEAVARMRAALAAARRRLVSAVTHAEILVGPMRSGPADRVEAALARLGIATVPVDADLARRAAGVRATTGLTLPDAFAVATALGAGAPGAPAALETFDVRVGRAYADLVRAPGAGGAPTT